MATKAAQAAKRRNAGESSVDGTPGAGHPLSCLHQTESDMLASEDKKKALTNPSSVFKNPADVIACKDLDKNEKAAILKQ
jgi:hypothetical protein